MIFCKKRVSFLRHALFFIAFKFFRNAKKLQKVARR